MYKDKDKYQQNKEFQGNFIEKYQNLWKQLQKIRAWSHTPGSFQIFIHPRRNPRTALQS